MEVMLLAWPYLPGESNWRIKWMNKSSSWINQFWEKLAKREEIKTLRVIPRIFKLEEFMIE